MIRFEVSINGEHVCTAGIENFGVVSAILSAVRRNPAKFKEDLQGFSSEAEFSSATVNFSVSGIDDDDRHVHWTDSLKIEEGDEIVLRMLPAGSFEEPATGVT